MYNNSTYKSSYSFNIMLIKVNQSEIQIKQRTEDKNNKNVKNGPGFAKTYNIKNQRNCTIIAPTKIAIYSTEC